jgi:bifunctional non-homologous end joining protein LigD
MTARKSPPTDRLARYREKRSADRTPEPFHGTAGRPRLFVVQKHAARSMHYDLRLEIGGALHSWAVPKGPSLDPQDKRLAVEVEEHPLEYADFEGLIPEGNYGAGAVIVWDRGRWESIGDPREGLEKGKLLFDLHGYKLRGRWTLFRTKRKASDWLLMKKPDGHADPEQGPGEESIHSGLTVEELRDGADPAAGIRSRLLRLKAPKADVRAASVRPMLARTAEKAFSRDGWVFELKYDGFRLLCAREGERVLLRYRRGMDATAIFPEIATALRALPHARFLLDGEVVVLDTRAAPHSVACSSVSSSGGPPRSPGRRSSCRRRCLPSICSPSDRSTCGRCRCSSANGFCAVCCRPPGRCATRTTSRRTVKRCSTRCGGCVWRGSSPSVPTRLTPPGAPGTG